MDTLNRGIYRKMFGFKTHEELLEHMTIGDKVKKIRVPTFGLSAKNDQVCDDSFVPRKQVEDVNCPVILGVTEYGSHAGHLTGWLYPQTWYQYPCMEFIEFLEKKHRESK